MFASPSFATPRSNSGCLSSKVEDVYRLNAKATMCLLERLPPEIFLQVLQQLTPPDLASLVRVSRSYHIFIDELNQDRVYAKQCHGPDTPFHLDKHAGPQFFTSYVESPLSWKERCRRRYLLRRRWIGTTLSTRHAIFSAGQMIWRFRCDFERRFIIASHEEGGLTVLDMDDGTVLWQVPIEEGFENAHLDYDGCWMCCDHSPESVRLWRYVSSSRGTFEFVTDLPRLHRTRGFSLKDGTLIMVGDDGQAFIWNLPADINGHPVLQKSLQIQRGAKGHLTQTAGTVMISQGVSGYHFYDKTSGALMGRICPTDECSIVHVQHPTTPWYLATEIFNPRHAGLMNDRDVPVFKGWDETRESPLTALNQRGGPGPYTRTFDPASDTDQWGSGRLEDNIMVGISRRGRLCICFDWGASIASETDMVKNTVVVDCLANPQTFAMAGWLDIKNRKIAWQVSDQLYLLQLLKATGPSDFRESISLHCCRVGGAAMNSFPVSCIQVADDGIAHTFAAYHSPESRFDLKKAIRIISFAPPA